MKKIVLIPIILILLPILVYAIPPFTPQTSTTGGLTIEYPKFEYIPYGKNFEIHFHVFNSTGYIVTNTTTTCYLHLYNYTNHLLKLHTVPFADTFDYEAMLNTSILSKIGQYSYIIQCNNTKEAGFVSGSFFVTKKVISDIGEDITGMVIALVLTTFILLYFSFKLDNNHFLLKLLLIFFALYCIIMLANIELIGLYNTGESFSKFSNFLFLMFIIYFFVYVVWYYFKQMTIFTNLLKKFK